MEAGVSAEETERAAVMFVRCGGWLGTRGRLGGVSMVTRITGRGGLAHEGKPLVSPLSFLSLSLFLFPSLPLGFDFPLFLVVVNF